MRFLSTTTKEYGNSPCIGPSPCHCGFHPTSSGTSLLGLGISMLSSSVSPGFGKQLLDMAGTSRFRLDLNKPLDFKGFWTPLFLVILIKPVVDHEPKKSFCRLLSMVQNTSTANIFDQIFRQNEWRNSWMNGCLDCLIIVVNIDCLWTSRSKAR